uniref:Uncharacterized protein n=1 Tax=Panagrolaimus superbus TaxID=310955 RepID=A0A914Z412_9BILA
MSTTTTTTQLTNDPSSSSSNSTTPRPSPTMPSTPLPSASATEGGASEEVPGAAPKADGEKVETAPNGMKKNANFLG